MKRLLIGALAGTAALLAATAANALTFVYTGGLAAFTASTSGYYEIDVWGAQGGSYSPFTPLGGLGAMVGGRVYLDAGEILGVLVGGQGGGGINGNTAAGGGGGSFVFISSELLLAAGGGGGSGFGTGVGGPGLAGRDGGGSGGGLDGLGGGSAGDSFGAAGGGAGWLGPGASGTTGIHGDGGLVGLGGGTHGCISTGGLLECENGPSGGFGGGGGGSYNDGGGGGGYSGGGGGSFGAKGGGGGGSYIADVFYDTVALSGVRSGDGLVTIDPITVPEPATWAMMLIGVLGLGSLLRRRRPGLAQ